MWRPSTVGTNRVEIIDALEDFRYYGACGNETVLVGETEFFPVLPDDLDRIEQSRYPHDGESTETPDGLVRVVPPGPGDDTGTIIVYADGMARHESDSGRVLRLTDRAQTYNWEC